ncbi:hypothetical protein ACJMK2_030974 [Sinanodonta woodiana]|uniref:Uncharacterized protein n=1 Tax=Sinanodonta woodiana TaxID=1069815 RepID=A0ABD3WZG4_SINWO
MRTNIHVIWRLIRLFAPSLAWKEYQHEAIFSLIGAILSVCLLSAQTIVMCKSKANTSTKNISILAALGACASIGSALLGFIVVGRMAYVILQLTAQDDFPQISSPYALIIFGIGSLVFVCVCAMELALPGMIRRETQTPFTVFENVAI